MVQVNCMPDFVESIVDNLGGFFEEHPLVAGAVSWVALDQLGCCYHDTVERVQQEEELQFVAIVRAELRRQPRSAAGVQCSQFRLRSWLLRAERVRGAVCVGNV